MKNQVVMDNDPQEIENKKGEFCDYTNILTTVKEILSQGTGRAATGDGGDSVETSRTLEFTRQSTEWRPAEGPPQVFNRKLNNPHM